jgi:long-chain acyl-CoA synthetase
MPRGVCLSHRNLYHDVTACIEHTHMDPEQRFLGVLPLFHTFGLTALLLAPTILGAGCSYHARFQPLDVLRTLAEDQISIFIAIPSMYAALARAKSASPEMFRSLRLPISGGEPLSPDLYDEYRDRFGVTILEGYGLTETSPVVAVNLPWANRAGTVGTPLPGVEVMSAGEDGRPVPPGESGEICVRGPTVMRGYYNRPDDTAAVLGPDGWLHTGDLGRIDPDGFISITGRKKDLIIVGGENVFPREVETVLEQHPAVAESSVIGVSDPSRGEVVVGFVIPREGASVTPLELRDFCRDRLAGFKVPRQIIIDRDLPRGPTGKVLKRVLRARMQDQRACAGVS